MGYQMFQRSARFRIAAEKVDAALAAIHALRGREPIHDASGAHFAFVDTAEAYGAKSLGEALAAWRWDVGELAADGSIVDLEFAGENHGDEDILFAALAPYVQTGSRIEMIGEDGEVWCWAFKDGELHRLLGNVTFEAETDSNRLRLDDCPGYIRFKHRP